MNSKGLYMDGDKGNRCRGTWSELPVLLLWMVKDKLDIFGNMQLVAVCRHWNSTSASYPKRPLQSVGDGLPWFFQLVGNDSYSSTRQELISVIRNHKFVIDLDEFQEASVLFSKRGWILLRRQISSLNPRKRYLPDSSFTLVNLFTRVKIKFSDPDVVNYPPFGFYGSFSAGSFSTNREGYPHCVVLRYEDRASRVTLRIAFITGEVDEVSPWIERTYFYDQPEDFSCCCNFVIIGQRVYCYDLLGRMIIYDMASDSWKKIVGTEHWGYIAELDGDLMRIERHDFNFRFFKVFRYNDVASAWEQFAVRDTSWYLTYGYKCFAAKEKGLNVYKLFPWRDLYSPRDPNLFFHDLLTRTTQTFDLPYPPAKSAAWIDIG